MHKIFLECTKFSMKIGQNNFWNTQNLSLIMRKMFPELHQMFCEIQKIFLW